jgi:adenylate kinase family enzyme
MTKCDRLLNWVGIARSVRGLGLVKLRIVGTSGSGKSRLARELARRRGLPRLELDEVFWDAGWTFRDLERARAIVSEFVAAHPDGWVVEGNWTTRLDGLLDPGTPGGADAFVWLDPSRPVLMSRVVRRTVWRGIRRTELWHGNRENPANWLRRDPEVNIMRWAWTQHAVTRERMRARAAAGMPVVRLSTRREVDAWLAGLDAEPGAPGGVSLSG